MAEGLGFGIIVASTRVRQLRGEQVARQLDLGHDWRFPPVINIGDLGVVKPDVEP